MNIKRQIERLEKKSGSTDQASSERFPECILEILYYGHSDEEIEMLIQEYNLKFDLYLEGKGPRPLAM